MFYREVQTQARPITRQQSIKDTFSEFAETMIAKLKSYFTQCNVYQNQSLKGNFRNKNKFILKIFFYF